MSKCGYVLAGMETLFTILDNFMNKNTKKRFDNQFTHKQVSNFLSKSCHGFLHSFGQNFSGKKKYDKYLENESYLYRFVRDSGFADNCKLIVDSGGFQASVGRIDKNETRLLIDLYHQFIIDNHQLFDRAFILDLPPGPGCKLFKTFKEVYDYNLETYNIAKNLPQAARDKIIYIHHFRTPKLWDIYTKILNTDDMFNSFNHFGTGGIVANMASDVTIPCIIYVIPLIPLINKALKYGKKKLPFHILGGANFRDVLFYELFQKVVKEKHDIELEISYDSSGLWKQLMIGRFVYALDDNVHKIDIRSPNLKMRFKDGLKVEDKYIQLINELTVKYNFKPIHIDTIYNPDTNTFYEEIKVYTMFHMLDTYAQIQNLMGEVAKESYPLYAAGEFSEFNTLMELTTRKLNIGKITKKQKAKSSSIKKSLDMLTDLDEEYCKYLVTKCLSKDEFTELSSKNRVLTI
jgi:hypothetical protein